MQRAAPLLRGAAALRRCGRAAAAQGGARAAVVLGRWRARGEERPPCGHCFVHARAAAAAGPTRALSSVFHAALYAHGDAARGTCVCVQRGRGVGAPQYDRSPPLNVQHPRAHMGDPVRGGMPRARSIFLRATCGRSPGRSCFSAAFSSLFVAWHGAGTGGEGGRAAGGASARRPRHAVLRGGRRAVVRADMLRLGRRLLRSAQRSAAHAARSAGPQRSRAQPRAHGLRSMPARTSMSAECRPTSLARAARRFSPNDSCTTQLRHGLW